MEAPINQEREREEAKRKYRELCAAYAKVFGLDDESRSPEQRKVYADMQYRGYINDTTMVPNREGMVQAIKMECAEGMRCFMLATNKFIKDAQRPQKPKPTVKK